MSDASNVRFAGEVRRALRWQVTRPCLLVILVTTVALVSCTLTTNLDGLAGGSSDGGSPDHALDSETLLDGATGDATEPTSILVNGSFEGSSSGCGAPWVPYRSDLARNATARTGSSSCRVCARQPSGGYTIDYGSDQSPQVAAGETYHVRAWVRRVPGATKALLMALTITVYDANGNDIDPGRATTPSATVADEWTALDNEYTAPKSGRLNFYVENTPSSAGDCFLIDDASAWRVR